MSKNVLGRGLSSLIPSKNKAPIFAANSALGKENQNAFSYAGIIANIEIGKISKNPGQMRKIFDSEAMNDLAESIKMHGILQPLVVTEKSPGAYELIAGERRLEASKIAGLVKVPVIVRTADAQQKLELALVENIQREALSPIEEATAYKELSAEFNLTQEEVAARSGKSRSRVANFLRLLSLPLEIQNAINEKKISEGHGRAILSLANPEKQRALFQEILKNNLTVRQAEEKVKLVSVAGHTRKIGRKDSPWKETENILSEFLSTKVEVRKSGSGVKIIIDCYEGDMDRIAGSILNKEKQG
ncbi:ParB/RepB/Spo0J family partition protein [Patescibacteria group bacterium]|nr:ParB/RepB/Spo0J family partition protein [Patescibacteria group bacterium]